jgi:hypothetical protein
VWSGVVASDPAATIHQTPEWIDAVTAVPGYAPDSRLYEASGGRLLVLPLVRRTGLPGPLAAAESMPAAWGTGGLVATGGHLLPADVAGVWADLARERALRIRIRPEHSALDAWQRAERLPGVVVTRQAKSVVDLSGGFGEVWKRFRSSARTAVRKAERSGLDVEVDCTGRLVEQYYALFETWAQRRARESGLPTALMLRRATRAEPLRKYRAVATHLASACRIWMASWQGEPVAAAISLVRGGHASYWRGVSHRAAAGPLRANNLLQKLMIEQACEEGCTTYNMGWSGTQSLVDFKSAYGARFLDFPVYTLARSPVGGMETAAARTRSIVKDLAGRRAIKR